MTHRTTRTAALAEVVQLFDPRGAPLPLFRPTLELHFAADQLLEARLVAVVADLVWRRIERDQLFHLSAETRGPIFAGGFLPAVAIEIDVRLATRSLPMLALRAEDIAEAGALLTSGRADEELLWTESWYALYVRQQRGPISTGFRTVWAA
jgi:hypothetical protein